MTNLRQNKHSIQANSSITQSMIGNVSLIVMSLSSNVKEIATLRSS